MKRSKLRIAVSAAVLSALGLGTAAVAGSAANAATPRLQAVHHHSTASTADLTGPGDKADATDPSGPGDKADATDLTGPGDKADATESADDGHESTGTDRDNLQQGEQGGDTETNDTATLK